MYVINLFGAPCSGKSTLAAKLFYTLKEADLSTEYVYEYAKEIIYESRNDILSNDQLYIFAKQHRKLNRLINNTDYAICDSPLLLSNIYFNKNSNIYSWELFELFVLDTFSKYNNLNFLLNCPDKKYYNNVGRNKLYNESVKIHNDIKEYLIKHKIKYFEISWDNGINIICDALKIKNLSIR